MEDDTYDKPGGKPGVNTYVNQGFYDKPLKFECTSEETGRF